jgi:hypothetical protein
MQIGIATCVCDTGAGTSLRTSKRTLGSTGAGAAGRASLAEGSFFGRPRRAPASKSIPLCHFEACYSSTTDLVCVCVHACTHINAKTPDTKHQTRMRAQRRAHLGLWASPDGFSGVLVPCLTCPRTSMGPCGDRCPTHSTPGTRKERERERERERRERTGRVRTDGHSTCTPRTRECVDVQSRQATGERYPCWHAKFRVNQVGCLCRHTRVNTPDASGVDVDTAAARRTPYTSPCSCRAVMRGDAGGRGCGGEGSRLTFST